MPQSTNLNKNPYYDDFNESKNFYKVLFKPGVTVQTRELTTLQSILQNQIEKLGSAFFKKNTVVIPGGFAYDPFFRAVEIENTFKGTNVEEYFESLVGLTLVGKISNVSAKVEKVLSKDESIRSSTTLYVKYQSSSSSDFTSNVFIDGEELVLNGNINLNGRTFLTGSSIAKTIAPTNRKSTSIGSAAKIDDGVYFIRGFLTNVYKDTLILDQYSDKPSYRVGLEIQEQLIDASQDKSLYDNAQGFSNYAAPGADRLKISLKLTKKDLNDFKDENFIELFRVENGNLIEIKNQTDNSYITEILARRTFDESGNYNVLPFNVEALESLNDNLGNGGLYDKNDTSTIVVPSEDTAVVKVSPGKSYVKGYEVPTDTQLLSFNKPRTTKHVESSSAKFSTGNLIRVNNVVSIPNIGLTTNYTVSLYPRRVSNQVPQGTPIGIARVYDVASYLTSYNNSATQFNLNLFDIQTYADIVSDSSLTSISTGDYIKGDYSGSTGFVESVSTNTITLKQVSGLFIQNETLTINEIGSSVSIGTFINYSIEDVKSISGIGFTADTVLSNQTNISGSFNLTTEAGIGTIVSNNGASFASKLKVNDVIKYSQLGIGSDVYARVSNISTTKTQITINQVQTVPGVCSADLGISTSLSLISVVRPQIYQSDDPSLTANLNHKNISNVDFLNSNIFVKVAYEVTKYLGSIDPPIAPSLPLPTLSGDYVYSEYDSERYIVANADGSLENLDAITFTKTNGGKDVVFSGLSTAVGPCKVITTQIKSNVSQKSKKITRCKSVSLNRTKYETPLNAGLSYSKIYGTRVEDDQISLNTPDIITVHGIFESSTSLDPVVPWISITQLNSTNNSSDDLIIGELVVGSTSGAVAVYVEKRDTLEVYLVYKNDINFIVGETVTFSETGYTATVSSINSGDKNILNEYILDNGQRSYFYDFGRLIRKNNSSEPTGRLKIYFDSFSYNANDNGDLVSTNSYPSTLSKKLIPSFNNSRNSDIIDIRPRVSDYNPSTATVSPFDFASRVFTTSTNNPIQILSPYESFVFDYDFYLPRIDKLTLSKNGAFSIVYGEPTEVPVQPSISNEVLDVATIVCSPYVYDVAKDIQITITDNRRYTMSDLRTLDNRVSNLEYYTSLSLLEASTQNLLITDADNLNRSKLGFFVDEFSGYQASEIDNPSYNALVENNSLSATKNEERIDLSLFYDDDYTPLSNVDLTNTTCSNLKITGTVLSLDYSEIVSVNQPFASKTVNVNPFNVITWSGYLQLSPQKDIWTEIVNTTSSVANVSRRGTTAKVTSTERLNYIRTRNINFQAVRLKPNTKFNVVFDKKDLISTKLKSKAFPKFIEIKNNSGTFEIGETVRCLTNKGNVAAIFRICSPNHKQGPINSPDLKFEINPYNPSIGISTQYGPESTFLNIDIDSLSRKDISNFWGRLNKGWKLVGVESKATAVISDIRFITNEEGILMGSIWIDERDRFKTGQTTVDLTSQNPELNIPEVATSTIFSSNGTRVTNTTIRYYDPLAQTFIVEDENGIFPTSVDVFFKSKDQKIPVELQIREVLVGNPGGPDRIVPGLRKALSASSVGISSNATTKTTFKFDTLTRLTPGEYAVVLLSDSNQYEVWVSELGGIDISTVDSPAINKIFIDRQPSLGTLFKSQNGTTWVPSPYEDLKFTLNKAKFTQTGGTARFYNKSPLTENPVNQLPLNPIVGISSVAPGAIPNDGRHILVTHPNHGMYGSNNYVEIKGVESDVLPTKLTVSYASTDTGTIYLNDITNFTSFEGSAVSPSNPGYIKINDEIIEYTGIGGESNLLNISRNRYGSPRMSHDLGDFVYKYEFNNVSLARINTTLQLASDPTLKATSDTYYAQIDPGSLFSQTKSGGGENVYASKNVQFSEIKFDTDIITKFDKTQVTASIKTISSTSINGSEVSFLPNDPDTVDIEKTNKFNSPRMIASRVNEVEYLNPTNFVGSKSLTLELNLNTEDTNISPIIDLEQNFAIGSIYNLNQPVGLSSYSTDSRVNSNIDDPHSFVHVTNRIDLQNSAKSIQVLFSAYRHASSDIRVLYKIYTNEVPDDQQVWQLFPGYDNLDINGDVINPDNNSGRPDSSVRSSLADEFLDYKFSIDDLSPFTGFQIKIVGTGTNQAFSPIIKELRVIALK